jgi:hypothetical protein
MPGRAPEEVPRRRRPGEPSDRDATLLGVPITSNQAEKIESRLIELGFDPEALKDWFMRRIYQANENGRRVTHYRSVRGSHGETYVWDAEGTDELPPGYEAPRRPDECLKRPRGGEEARLTSLGRDRASRRR